MMSIANTPKIIPYTSMKIATKNPKATCHPHNHQNINPRTPSIIMATTRSKYNSEKCH